MRETEELIALTDKLYQDYMSLDAVKEYIRLRDALKDNKRLNDLKDERSRLQKDIRYLKNEKKDECMKACKELQIAYDEDPLVVNYKSAYLKALSLLRMLDETKL